MNERQIIDTIAALAGPAGGRLFKGIGDDCAVIGGDSGRAWLLTMDTLIEGVHFDPAFHPPELLGRKAVSVNVSDIAAMGGVPAFALLSAGLPPGFDQDWFAAFARGLAGACADYGCRIIGGDTVASPAGYNFSLTLIGEAETEQVLYRSSARVGDTIWVSGDLGLAAAGLALLSSGLGSDNPAFDRLRAKHLDPPARVALGRELAASRLVHAMMDLSDGLATDLAHLCDESGVGARVIAADLPGPATLAAAARLVGADAEQWAIGGGEDFELLFTAPAEAADRLRAIGTACGLVLTPVGQIVAGTGVVLVGERADGGPVEQPIAYQGYDHFPDHAGGDDARRAR